MASVNVPTLDYNAQLVDPASGKLTRYGYELFRSLQERTGGQSDKVDAAHAIASAAVPQVTEVIGSGGLQEGGALGGNIGVSLYMAYAAVADLPTAKAGEGDWAYALDGRKPGETTGSGTGVPCFWSSGGWISACDGAAVSA
ncbi:MAG TPA: hypothetical protein VG166_09185 [Caulobacteraceae bacterium]|jgi:hypothetical protein|nr:hypothetical protein [Caulobacteraceae bacterium]